MLDSIWFLIDFKSTIAHISNYFKGSKKISSTLQLRILAIFNANTVDRI